MTTSDHLAEHALETSSPPAAHAGGRFRRTLPSWLSPSRLSGIYTWALLIVLFGIWVPETFLTTATARSVGASSAVTLIAALALIIPLACGLFDLSVAATLGVAAVLSLHLQNAGVGVGLSIIACLGAGAVIGAVNGVLVVRIGINSFIATLGLSSILASIAYWITAGNQVVAEGASGFLRLGQGTLLGLPVPVWYALAIAAIIYYVTEWTTVGRYLYAIGGNIDAARLAGIRIDRVLFGSLVSSGVLAAFAGVVLSAQLGSSSPDIGPAYLLPAFSAVLLGATQIKTNGRVNVVGTLVAVILLATGIYGLQLAGAPSFISSLFNGAALIIAVSLSIRANRS